MSESHFQRTTLTPLESHSFEVGPQGNFLRQEENSKLEMEIGMPSRQTAQIMYLILVLHIGIKIWALSSPVNLRVSVIFGVDCR